MADLVPADDRGFTLGDGLFETVLAVDGDMPRLAAHLARMAAGCAILGLPAPNARAIREAALQALGAASLMAGRAAVRLTYTAGSGGRGLDRPAALAPRLVATAAPSPKPLAPARLAVASIRRNDRSPASRLKTLAYLDNVLAREEARAAGADEAILLNTLDEVACAGAANLFWIEGKAMVTPALACGVLGGIMRASVLAAAPALDIEVVEVRAGLDRLLAADAVLLSNSLIGLRPVASIDGRAYDPWPKLAVIEASSFAVEL
ncbi:aminotransferase class IV [Phenylobacterium immobile]|uniref:aminotransferase class IV n=1 Tax=Phenylobacterium immobile TaxID=21 RepID=UPI000AF7FF31|nr:aminotransferase class IV [Phenylobacterium immobile]